MDPRKIERIVKGVTKAQQQEARRAVVKTRLENNSRDGRRAIVVAPRLDVLEGVHA